MLNSSPKTPCIGLCSTVFGDSVCRGCMRFIHEVIDWNRYDATHKTIIWQRLDEHLRLILPQYVRIYDPRQIIETLQQQHIVYDANNLWRGIYQLLRVADKGMKKGIINLEQIGFSVKNHYRLVDIQEKLYELAFAYYEKDFLRATKQESDLNRSLIKIPVN
ncbi:MAG: DUF1289 domain-containing protein [Moraxellaceae bacterium]|nr:DUF1289 domain-containing protein [Moraxellaceae bacterium]